MNWPPLPLDRLALVLPAAVPPVAEPVDPDVPVAPLLPAESALIRQPVTVTCWPLPLWSLDP